VDEILNMCNDDLSLEDLHLKRKDFEELHSLSPGMEVAKFMFDKMQKKEKFSEIKQLVYLLAFLPSGLTLYDF